MRYGGSKNRVSFVVLSNPLNSTLLRNEKLFKLNDVEELEIFYKMFFLSV